MLSSETRHERIPSFNPFSGHHDVTRDPQGNAIGETVHNKTYSLIGEETHTYTTTGHDGKVHETRSRDRLGRVAGHLGTSTKANEKRQPVQVLSSNDYSSYDNGYGSGNGGRLAGNDASSRNNPPVGRILTSLLVLAGFAFAIKEYRKEPEDVYGDFTFESGYEESYESRRADWLRIDSADELLRQANELLERVERESANRLQESIDPSINHKLSEVIPDVPVEKSIESKIRVEAPSRIQKNISRKNFDYTEMERPSHIAEQKSAPRKHDAKIDYEVQANERRYSSVESARPASRWRTLVSRRTVDANGNVLRSAKYTIEGKAKPYEKTKPFEIGFTYPHTGRDYEVRDDMNMYNAIVSPTTRPRGYIPTARKIVDDNGNVSRRIEYMSKDDAKEMKSDEIGFTYPSTGRHYVISKERYPEFYRKLDRDGDGLISQYEISKVWKTFSNITGKHPEGNIESIVRDFMRKTEGKFGPFR